MATAPGSKGQSDTDARPEIASSAERPKRIDGESRDLDSERTRLLNMVPSHVWQLSTDGEPVFFNQRMVEFLGLDLHGTDRAGMTRLAAWIDTCIHPDDAKEFGGELRRCLDTGEPFAIKHRLRRADGVHRWMSSTAEAIRGQTGGIVQWCGLCHDIDEQVRAEEELRQRERQLRQMIDSLPVRAFSTSPTGETVRFNKSYEAYLRSVVPDFDDVEEPRIATLVQELLHPEDVPKVQSRVKHCFATGEPFSMRYRRRDSAGVYRWMEGRMAPSRDLEGTIVEWSAINLDVDDEVRAQEALRARERELSLIVDMVPSHIWRLSPDGEPNFYNRRMLEYIGADAANVARPGLSRLASTIEAAVHPDDAAKVAEALQHSFRTGEPFSNRHRLRRADGVYHWMSSRAEPLRAEDGRILQWYGHSLDIEDLVTAEEALRARERELSLLVDMVPSNLWRVSPEGVTTLANRRMADFLGWDLDYESRLESAFDTIFHPDDAEKVAEVFGRCLLTGERFSMRYRLLRFDGAYRWMSGRAEPMRDESGRIVQWFGLCHDIDDQVLAEEALRRVSDRLAQANRAASLAELSASIAHEVNQPLAAIVANSHACYRWLSAESPNLERAMMAAERITRDANSAAEVVDRVRALFQQTPRSRASEDLNGLIREVCRLMADEILAKGARIEISLESDLPSVALDRVQVQQVLVNLIRNAVQAMDTVVDRARCLWVRSRLEDPAAIRVEVQDSGTGIMEPERVVEPFFTTKRQGMGMGLAICRSIVEAHGGRLWLSNNATHGALIAFTLALPKSREHGAEPQHSPNNT